MSSNEGQSESNIFSELNNTPPLFECLFLVKNFFILLSEIQPISLILTLFSKNQKNSLLFLINTFSSEREFLIHCMQYFQINHFSKTTISEIPVLVKRQFIRTIVTYSRMHYLLIRNKPIHSKIFNSVFFFFHEMTKENT